MWLCEYPGLSFQRSPARACSLVSSLLQRGYDEPAILSYAISSFCPTSDDGLSAFQTGPSQDAAHLKLAPGMRWSVSGSRPSFVRLVTQQWHRPESGLWARLRTAIRRILRHPRGPRSGHRFTLGTDRTSIRYSIARRPIICCTFVTRHVMGLLQAFCYARFPSARQPPSLARHRPFRLR